MSIDLKHSIFRFLDEPVEEMEDKSVKLDVCAGGKTFECYHVTLADEGLLIRYVERIKLDLSPEVAARTVNIGKKVYGRAFIPYSAVQWVGKRDEM
jgi:hypothetical protein